MTLEILHYIRRWLIIISNLEMRINKYVCGPLLVAKSVSEECHVVLNFRLIVVT